MLSTWTLQYHLVPLATHVELITTTSLQLPVDVKVVALAFLCSRRKGLVELRLPLLLRQGIRLQYWTLLVSSCHLGLRLLGTLFVQVSHSEVEHHLRVVDGLDTRAQVNYVATVRVVGPLSPFLGHWFNFLRLLDQKRLRLEFILKRLLFICLRCQLRSETGANIDVLRGPR